MFPGIFRSCEPTDCHVQVFEETGYDLTGQINQDHLIEMSIKQQKISLYIVPGVPEDYPFKTRTRKEISVSYPQLVHAHRSPTVPTENRLVQAV